MLTPGFNAFLIVLDYLHIYAIQITLILYSSDFNVDLVNNVMDLVYEGIDTKTLNYL